MESLLLSLPSQPDGLAEWVVIDSNGQPHAAVRQGSLNAAVAHAKQRQLIVLTPSEDILLNTVEFPSRNKRKLQQALPYVFEEELAEEPESLHFALGPETSDATGKVKFPVAIVTKAKVQEWLQRLREAGLKPMALIPNILSLPNREGWSVMAINNGVSLVKTSSQHGFACDHVNLKTLLIAALTEAQEADLPSTVKVWHYGDSPEPLEFGDDIAVDNVNADKEPIALFAHGYKNLLESNQIVNLLQGDFAIRQDYSKLLLPWRGAAALLLAWLLVAFLGKGVEYLHLNSTNQELTVEMQKVFKDTFPKTRKIPRGKEKFLMEQKIKALGGAGSNNRNGFLPLLDTAIQQISQNLTIRITSIKYNQKNLDLELIVPTLQALDSIKAKLDQQPQIRTEIQSASAEGETVNARLRITGR